MEPIKFKFDHELAAQLRAGLEQSTRDAREAGYREITEWMLRVAVKLVLWIVALCTDLLDRVGSVIAEAGWRPVLASAMTLQPPLQLGG